MRVSFSDFENRKSLGYLGSLLPTLGYLLLARLGFSASLDRSLSRPYSNATNRIGTVMIRLNNLSSLPMRSAWAILLPRASAPALVGTASAAASILRAM